ncbi:MAG: DUF4058 family protein [Thermoguttaceae bacterium]|jgi:hypothetical protein|nr:DUF4058 family protein [Thermoguttaceae bacterium]
MPLRDHFRPPLSEFTSWEGIHGGWPMVIVQQLGKRLPPRYVAEPRVHLGSQVEIDVAAYDHEDVPTPSWEPNQAEPGTAVWAPAQPTLAVETELADFDEYEVRVFDLRRGRRLVAAVELISPANKDRAENRNQFTAKCAALLRQGVSLVLVDLVTVRSVNLYDELLRLIGQRDPTLNDQPPATYAAACRWRPRGASRWLEVWNHPLTVGAPLPCLPLWLADDLAVPLDLEASYEQTCRDLRIA